MAGKPMQPVNNDERKELIRQQIASTKLTLAPTDGPIDLTQAKKVPLGQIASIGAAFVSMPKAFRTVTQTLATGGGGTLLRAFTEDGIPLDISMLQKFNDGSGALGSTRFGGTFQQARLKEADPQALTNSSTIPYDSATIAMAIALEQINQKLDNIQKTADEMFDYMRQRDKSKIRGNLKALTDFLNEYQLNWDNPRYVDSAHNQVLCILREAQQDMDLFGSQVRTKLSDKSPLEVRGMVEVRLDGVLDSLKDYQLATYIYAFALFLDPILSENFKTEKLDHVISRIEEVSVQYRQTYTAVYNALEGAVKGSVDAVALGGLAAAGKFLGKAIAATPVGEHTPIDEALANGGMAVEKFNLDKNSHLLEKLHAAKSPDVLPFQESARDINALYNQPSQLLTDGENLYVLPSTPENEDACFKSNL